MLPGPIHPGLTSMERHKIYRESGYLCDLLYLTCLVAEEGATTAKRHLIINATKLIKPMYFEIALT